MTPPGSESQTLRDLIEDNLDEAVDYESDTVFVGPDGSPLATLTGEDDTRHAPNPFPERGAADALTALRDPPDVSSTVTVTNPLDEQQQRAIDQEEGAKRRTKNMTRLQDHRQYRFKPPTVEERLKEASGHSLSGWTIGPEAISPEDVATRTALRQRYLEPHITTQSQYLARLNRQMRGAPVPPMKGVPILLFAGETEGDEDTAFSRWAHYARRLSSMWALRASADVADIRLERKMRYDYAKLKARGKLKSQRTHYAPAAQQPNVSATPVTASPRQAEAVNPPTPTITGEKRQRQQADPAHDAQKRPRRTGNPAEGGSQIPMNSMIRDNPAISPDTGFDHGDDASAVDAPHGTAGSPAHRAKEEEVGVSEQAHAELVQEVRTLREERQTMNSRLESLEESRTRMQGQLDLLVQMLRPPTMPMGPARAP
ncbi:unnamed protein product [Peronospora effusa]|nr:unnamed protein product [Peronospora effusa]